MKALYATDGSDDSDQAGRTLIALGLPPDTEVVLLYVKETLDYLAAPVVMPPYHAQWHQAEQELLQEAEEAAERAVERGKRVLDEGGITPEVMVGEGHAAEQIVKTASDIAADLVVVGAKGKTASLLFRLGSAAVKVIKYAPCSVLMTKPAGEVRGTKVSKVLLPTDGSEHSAAAARFLSKFHLADDAEIVVLHVLKPEPHFVPQSEAAQLALEDLRQARRDSAERLVEDVKRHLGTAARVTTAVRDGDPAEQILKAGSEMGADLIVMGSKGLGGIKLFLLGSVSQKVCRYSDASVMLVKPHPTS